MDEAEHAGDPRHPDHDAYLTALGRAMFAAASVASAAFDLLRVLGDSESSDLYDDVLARLISKMRERLDATDPDIAAFVELLDSVRTDRNDLIHALPVLHGLYRRRRDDAHYVRTFYDVAELDAVTERLTSAAREGNRILYRNDGAAVKAWYGDRP